MKTKTKLIITILIITIFASAGIVFGIVIINKPTAKQLAAEAFLGTKTSLYGASKKVEIGAAVTSKKLENKEFELVLNQNFNFIAPEYEMKWNRLQPEIDKFNFSEMDKIAKYARENNKEVYGHTLIWNRNIPDWVEPYLNTFAEEKRGEALNNLLKEYISKVVNRYKDVVKTWDVLNEVLVDIAGNTDVKSIYRKDGILSKYLGTIDKYGVPEYVKLVFNYTKEADGMAKLFYNDYHTEYYNSPDLNKSRSIKSENMYQMASNLLKAGVPIDGVGIQSHVTNNKMLDREAFNKDNIQNYPIYKTIQAYQKLGLKVRITEMDVLLYEDKLPSPKEEQLKKQANTYSNYLLACLLSSNCTGFSVWNISDNHVWYGDNVPGKMENYHPNIFDRNYKPKPAYFALLKTLQNN